MAPFFLVVDLPFGDFSADHQLPAFRRPAFPLLFPALRSGRLQRFHGFTGHRRLRRSSWEDLVNLVNLVNLVTLVTYQ